MKSPLQSLKKVIPPPASPVCAAGDWKAVEKGLGFKLPVDYKRFIAAYGTGSIQSFMHMWNYLDFPINDIRDSIQRITSEFEYDKRAGYPIEYIPYPQPGCLIPFCSTDDGNYLTWRTQGVPSKWDVVAYDSGSGSLVHAKVAGMVACIMRLVQQKNPFGDKFCNTDIFDPPVTFTPKTD